MARKQRDVDRGTLKVFERAAVVEHGVGLGMHHVVVLILQRIVARAPREKVVVECRGRTVVAHRKDAVVSVGDARAHLRVGVFTAALRGNGHAHKELIPANNVAALARRSLMKIVRHGRHLRNRNSLTHCSRWKVETFLSHRPIATRDGAFD